MFGGGGDIMLPHFCMCSPSFLMPRNPMSSLSRNGRLPLYILKLQTTNIGVWPSHMSSTPCPQQRSLPFLTGQGAWVHVILMHIIYMYSGKSLKKQNTNKVKKMHNTSCMLCGIVFIK